KRLWQDSYHESVMEQAKYKDEQMAMKVSLSQLIQRREEEKYEQYFSVTAPASGRINNLLQTEGDQLDSRRPFVSIVADKPTYEAQIFVPSRAVGKIASGQRVLLNYDAFPFQQYGSQEAIIRSIEAAAIDPREHLIPLEINEPVYLIKADLVPDTHGLNLRPGMQFSAQLVTGEKTILQTIFEPLTLLGRRLE
ncbi:MAG: HlyD family secretion protein, partial [Gammaproteobacteria bacterium]|nr:HlyD family secretion protein [Gammaproteobacteria bacterium]